MSEPTLETIEDYNTLKGEKRRVVWAVVLAGLVMGIVYSVVYSYYDNKDDSIEVHESIKSIPVK
ncbi:hypothetical protein KJ877_06795 [bacterium]|nr:hypothetical protein [bacterium]MBU1991350.1 hypothetical protein [bacterium]